MIKRFLFKIHLLIFILGNFSNQNVVASSGATGSISVLLHSHVVIMNISEHVTRVRAQDGKAQQGTKF